ncbi:MAG: hypothetical protein ACNFW9_00050 [Candidatus Kerfeldbacteria bacterium]|jgi:hypothetical protein
MLCYKDYWLDWGEDLSEDLSNEEKCHQWERKCPLCCVDLSDLDAFSLAVGFSSKRESFRRATRGHIVPGAIIKRCPFCLQLFWHHIPKHGLIAYTLYILNSEHEMRFTGVKMAFMEMVRKRDKNS